MAILGSSSRLAQNWLELSEAPPLIISSRATTGGEEVDFLTFDAAGDLSDLERLLREYEISVLVNSIAVTNVEECEKHPHLAWALHVDLPSCIAAVCKRLGVKFVHVSTDHVSDSRRRFLRESDETGPLNQYGLSKLKGEQRVLSDNPDSIVLRTNFFGVASGKRKTFSSWIIEELRSGNYVELFADVFFTPIYAGTLIQATSELLAQDAAGIFNVASPDRLSKFEFALMLAEAFDLNTDLVRPIRLEDRRDLLPRPNEMGLDTKKISEFLGHDMPALSEQMAEYAKLTGGSPHPQECTSSQEALLGYGGHALDETDILAVARVLRQGPITQGTTVDTFERAIADRVQAEYAVAVSSGTAGLHLAMLSAGVNASDNVVTSPISFVASANAAQYVGASIHFSDIDPESLNVDRQTLRDTVLSSNERNVLIPVHFGGLAANLGALSNDPELRFEVVVEDAAHALGAVQPNGLPVGSCTHSDMTVFSLHPVKSITTGEGGIVTTNDPNLYRQLLRFRSHGITKGSDPFLSDEQAMTEGCLNPWYYEMQALGFNYRLTDIQAALGISQLEKLDAFMEHRLSIALLYDTYLRGNPLIQPAQKVRAGNAHHLYPVRIDFAGASVSRRHLMDTLRSMGIGTQVHYIPIPMHPFYRSLGFTMESLPNAAGFYEQALSLPIHMGVAKVHVRRVVDALNSILGLGS